MDRQYRFLSWGMGTQSTALAAMSALGAFDLPKLDAVIAADTGWERQVTYQIRDWYKPWLEAHGIPVHIVSCGKNIRQDGAAAHIHIPFYTANGGPLRRQCTRHFKIRPVKRRAREIAGYHPSQPPNPPPDLIEQWLGISLDEYKRMKPSGVDFIKNRWPLVEHRLTRSDCIIWLRQHGLPVPEKSACIGCPYRSASEWLDMQYSSPAEWQDAVNFDQENRHNPLAETDNVHSDQLYLHRSLQPLDQVDFHDLAERERGKHGYQIPMLLECDSGYCHV